MRIVGFVQARMNSARYPGKMLARLGKFRLIEWVLLRALRSKELAGLVLLTSDRSEDDALAAIAKAMGCEVFRGSEIDVLSRYIEAKKLYPADAYVRICADNPFLCPNEIDRLCRFFSAGRYDYAFNHIPRLENEYPDGFGAEILTSDALDRIGINVTTQATYREHATQYIWDHSSEFQIGSFKAPVELRDPIQKFDIDLPQDLVRLEKLAKQIDIETSGVEILRLAQKKYKLLVLASTFPSGAGDTSPRFVLDQCKALNDTGRFECLVVAPHSSGAKTAEILEGVNVRRFRYAPFERYEVISGNGIVSRIKQNPLLLVLVPSFFFAQLVLASSIARSEKVDLILANWILPQGFVASILKRLFPRIKTVVFSLGGDVGLIEKIFWLCPLAKASLSQMDRIIACSSFLKEKLYKLFPENKREISVIAMGVPDGLIERKSMPREQVQSRNGLLFVGRIEEKKGLSYLILAFALAKKSKPDLFLTIVGDGTLRKDCEVLVSKNLLNDSVLFLGSVQHAALQELYLKAEVLVVPSINTSFDYEGLPVTILEAIAAGTPVITTNAGGISDVIEHYKTGILVPQRDVEALADAILHLIGDSEGRKDMALQARKKIENEFTYSQIAEKYKALLLPLLQEKTK